MFLAIDVVGRMKWNYMVNGAKRKKSERAHKRDLWENLWCLCRNSLVDSCHITVNDHRTHTPGRRHRSSIFPRKRDIISLNKFQFTINFLSIFFPFLASPFAPFVDYVAAFFCSLLHCNNMSRSRVLSGSGRRMGWKTEKHTCTPAKREFNEA